MAAEHATAIATDRNQDFDSADSVGLFVGVSVFPRGRFPAVPFAADDAVDLAHLFSIELGLMRPERVVLALSGEPVKPQSLQALAVLERGGARKVPAEFTELYEQISQLTGQAGARGLFVLSMATHGVSDQGRDFLLAADTVATRVVSTSVSVSAVFDDVARTGAVRRLVLLDACREFLSEGTRSIDGSGMSESFAEAIGKAEGQAVLTGCTLGGYSYDDPSRRNGVFTTALLDGLRGEAAGDDRGFITLRTLADFAQERVVDWVRRNRPHHAARCRGIGRVIEGPVESLPLAVNPVRIRALDRQRREAAVTRLWANRGEILDSELCLAIERFLQEEGLEAGDRAILVEVEALDGSARSHRALRDLLRELQATRLVLPPEPPPSEAPLGPRPGAVPEPAVHDPDDLVVEVLLGDQEAVDVADPTADAHRPADRDAAGDAHAVEHPDQRRDPAPSDTEGLSTTISTSRPSRIAPAAATVGGQSMGRKLALLWTVCFIAWLPYGVPTAVLPLMVTTFGLSQSSIGWVWVVGPLPFLLRILWAPLIDRYGWRRSGRHRSWMVPLQLMLAGAAAFAALLWGAGKGVALLFILLAMSTLAAVLVVAVDRLAVDLLEDSELGRGSVARTVGQHLGLLAGASGLLWASERFSVGVSFLLIAGAMLLTVAIPLILAPRRGVSPTEDREAPTFGGILHLLRRSLASRHGIWLLLFLGTYSLGETMADALSMPFLLDAGLLSNWIPWRSTPAVASFVAGSIAGGWLASRSARSAVVVTATLRAGTVAAVWLLSLLGPTAAGVRWVSLTGSFLDGALTTAIFAFILSRVEKRIAATHLTALVSIQVCGVYPGRWIAEALGDAFTFSSLFGFATLLSALALLLLLPLRHGGREASRSR